jgi:glycosyltransferase involved in cell wall biosynthesis
MLAGRHARDRYVIDNQYLREWHAFPFVPTTTTLFFLGMTGTQSAESRLMAAQDNRPLASVVIRNRNEREHLERLLQALSLQTVKPEVVMVDNESTDGSAEMAAASGAKLIHIARSEFTYGRAINIGVASAAADIIILLSSHSLPVGERFIESCLKPFSDPRVAAARCIHVEHAHEWLNPVVLEGPITWDISLSMLPESNGCVFRKAVWRQIPFDEQIEATEDRLWCYHVLNAGHCIAIAPAWYQYFPTWKFWPSLRKRLREQSALYRMTRRKPAYGRLARQVLLGAPREALNSAATVVGRSIVDAIAPLYARRPPRAGSVR